MSNGSSFPPKLIVTSAIKQQAVQKLFDYWTTKTNLLRNKQNPSLANDDNLTGQSTEFLEANSNLLDQPFWGKLTGLSRAKATNLFGVQEVSGLKKLRMQKDKLRAAVFIVLSGSASVTKGGDDESTVYGPGEVFGAVDMFNKVVDNYHQYDHLEPEFPDDIVEMENGTFLRIELSDLYNRVLNPIDDEEPDTREEDEAIAGIAWQELTEDDKFYIKVYKRTKELLNKNFFSFIDAYRMVPKNAKMPAFKFYNEGSLGRELYLHEEDPTFVIVIIEGCVRVDVSPTRQNSGPHLLSCKRKGTRPMHMKTSSMPLMILTAGSIICIQPATFQIGRKVSENSVASFDISSVAPGDFTGAAQFAGHGSVTAAMTVATSTSHMTHSLPAESRTRGRGKFAFNKRRAAADARKSSATAHIMSKSLNAPIAQAASVASRTGGSPIHVIRRGASEASMETSQSGLLSSFSLNTFNSIDTKVHKKSAKFPQHSHPANIPGAEYEIKLVFERMTRYLAIPIANFDKILHDDKLVMPKISREIRWHLAHSNGSIAERIGRLLPWIKGDMSFKPMDALVEQKHVNFTPAEPGNLNLLPGDDLNLTQGSFYIPQCEPIYHENPVLSPKSRARTSENSHDAIMQSMLHRLRTQQQQQTQTPHAGISVSASEESEVSDSVKPMQRQISAMTDSIGAESSSSDYSGFVTTDVEGERIRGEAVQIKRSVDTRPHVTTINPQQQTPMHPLKKAAQIEFNDSQRSMVVPSRDGDLKGTDDDCSLEVDLHSVGTLNSKQ